MLSLDNKIMNSQKYLTYKFRIWPNAAQRKIIVKTITQCRYIHNEMLSFLRSRTKEILGEDYDIYNGNKEYRNFAVVKELLKPAADPSWFDTWERSMNLYDGIDVSGLRYEADRVKMSFANYFIKGFGPPKYKGKKWKYSSYTTTHKITIGDGYIKTSKLKEIKCRTNRRVIGDIINATFVCDPGVGFFIIIKTRPPEKSRGSVKNNIDKELKAIGIDIGIKDLLILSNGVKYNIPNFKKQTQKRINRLTKSIQRRNAGGQNYRKACVQIAKIKYRNSCKAMDYLHKISKEIITKYDIICLETLNFHAMIIQNPFIKKLFGEAPMSEILRQLKYKAALYDKRIIQIGGNYPSSQLCSNCGYKNTKTKNLQVREWTCPQCGQHHDRDINAAINILNEGLRIINN